MRGSLCSPVSSQRAVPVSYLCHLSDGTACGHELGKRKTCLVFSSLVLTYTHLFNVDQANRRMWFVLAAKEKQRCFLCDGGQRCSST